VSSGRTARRRRIKAAYEAVETAAALGAIATAAIASSSVPEADYPVVVAEERQPYRVLSDDRPDQPVRTVRISTPLYAATTGTGTVAHVVTLADILRDRVLAAQGFED
jgi:hypothetical protein